MTRHELTAVVKLMFSPKLIGTTQELIAAHQKKALADCDAELVTDLGNALKEIAKLKKLKLEAGAAEAETATIEEAATLPATNEAEPEGGRRRSRS